MFTRSLQSVIENRLHQKKAIILIGARQVGKSTLFNNIVKQIQQPTLTLNCDEPETRQILTDINSKELALLIGKNKVVVIDEAQRVDNIGMTLKLITDNFPDIQLLATGSSSFELRNRLNEPLTGRKYEYTLYPMSTEELMHDKGLLYVKQTLDSRLLYGSYPDVLNNPDNAKEILMNLASSYLYKDILEHEGIRRPELINKLLIALALQVGSEVSYNELAKTIGTDNKTIERYIDMLEKCFVIFRLSAFSRNLRTELRKSKKIYFYDNGIRNAIIQNFAPLAMRQDVGALWENFFISERIKHNHYNGSYAQSYFWRTTRQQEVDYIEIENGEISAFEMKWNPNKKGTPLPKTFEETYSPKQSIVVTPENFYEWV